MDVKPIEICKKVKEAGGKAYFVGGVVRDQLLNKKSKDIDIEVFGLKPEMLPPLLGPSVKFCGESFGVFKVDNIDISSPRRERKVGAGHTGFDVSIDPFMSLKDAASRRDFTINAIYYDPLENKYEDPYDGISDLSARRLDVVSDRFKEDPLRVLRGMQFCSRFNLKPTNRTIFACRLLKGTFKELAKERVWGEWEKWAGRSVAPSVGLEFLAQTEWIDNFPELKAMIGCPQPAKYHPEGDVWTHTLHVCDEMAALGGDHVDMFIALLHDIGKKDTTKVYEDGKITAYGHAEHGFTLAREFFEKYFAEYLNKDLNQICQAILLHMYRPQPAGAYKQKSVRKFMLRKLGCISIDRFEKIIRADHYGRPPLPKVVPADLENFIKDCRAYTPPVIKGQDLLNLGWTPSPEIGRKLYELESQHIAFGYDREKLLSSCKAKKC